MRPSANVGRSESRRPNTVHLLFDEQLSEELSVLRQHLADLHAFDEQAEATFLELG
jgi:hypothetical protein